MYVYASLWNFVFFKKNISKNVAKNINKDLSNKYNLKVFHYSKKSATDALKTISKKPTKKQPQQPVI